MFPQNDASALSLRDYLYVLRRRKGTVILATFAVVLASLGVSFLQTQVYEARARVLVQGTPTLNTDGQGDSGLDERALQNEIDFIQSDQVRAAVREELGFPANVRVDDRNRVERASTSAPRTRTQSKAAIVANTFATKYIELRRQRAVDSFLATSNIIQAKIDEIVVQKTEVQAQLDAQIAPLQAELQSLPPTSPDRALLQQQIDASSRGSSRRSSARSTARSTGCRRSRTPST